MAVGIEDAPTVQGVPLRPITLAWFLKRSLIGLAILMVAMGGLAWLTYASIDPDLDGVPSTAEASKPHHEPAARVMPVDL
jgi:hypothetical protein